MRLESIGVAVVSLALCSSAAVASAQDRTDAPGFFRTKQVDGRWWLVDPAGELSISKGVTTVSFYQDRIRGTQNSPYGEQTAKYGSIAAWATRPPNACWVGASTRWASGRMRSCARSNSTAAPRLCPHH